MKFTDSLWNGIDGIVIDAVGTLIEPVPTVAEVYAAAAADQGVTLDPSLVRTRFARHFRDDDEEDRAGAMATDEERERARWRKIVADVLPEVPDFERAFTTLWYHFGAPGSWRCHADVAPALHALWRAGIAIRIGSNFDGRLREVAGGLPQLNSLAPSAILLSSEIGYRKPHPAFFESVCRSLELEPGRVLCVGDDLENDVLGARAAGLVGVFLDRKGLPFADVPTVSSLRELVAPLKRRPR